MGYQVPPYLLRGELVDWGRQEGQTVTPLMSVLSLGVRADERRARWLEDRLWREFTGGDRRLARMATFWRVDGADEAPQVVSLLGRRRGVLPLDRLTRREGLSEFLQALQPRGSRIDFVVYGGVKHDFGYGLALDLTTLEAHHDGLSRLLDAMDHVLGQLGAEVDALSSEDADDLSLHALRQLEAVACQGGVPIEPRVWRPESALVARLAGPALLTRAEVVQRLNVLLNEQYRERIPSQDQPAEGGFIFTRIMRVMSAGRCSLWEAATTLLQGQPMHVLQSVAWGGQLERGNTIEEDVRRVLESLGMEAPDQNRSIARLHAEPRGVLRTAWRGAAESLAKDIVCTLVDRMEGGWPHAEELLRDNQVLHSRKPLGQALAELTLGRAGQWIALLGTAAGLDEERHASLQEAVGLLRRVDDRLMPAVHDRRGPLPRDAAEPSQLCHAAMTVAREVLGGLPWHMQAPPVRGGAMHGDAWSHAEVALRELGVVPELGEEVGSRVIVWLDHDREATRLMRVP